MKKLHSKKSKLVGNGGKRLDMSPEIINTKNNSAYVQIDNGRVEDLRNDNESGESDHSRDSETLHLPRDGKGKFISFGEKSSKKCQQAVASKNYRDFKIVTRRLQSSLSI